MLFSVIYILFIVIAYFILIKTDKNNFEKVFMCMAILLGLLVQHEGNNSDITRYLHEPEHFHDVSWLFVFSGVDYVIQSFAKLLSYITTSPRVYAVIMYMAYAKLYLESIKVITERYEYIATSPFIYTIGLFVIIPFTYFNALRYAFAMLLFLLCIIKIFIENKKYFLIVLFLTPLIHFSFWILIPLPFIVLVTKNKLRLATVVCIVSLFGSNFISSGSMVSLSSKFLFQSVSERVEGYGSDSEAEYYAEKKAEERANMNSRGYLMNSSFKVRNNTIQYIILIVSLIGYKKIKKDKLCILLFVIILYSLSFANIASIISYGGRFFHFATALIIFLLIYIKGKGINNNFYYKYKYLFDLCFIAAIYCGLIVIYANRYMFNVID